MSSCTAAVDGSPARTADLAQRSGRIQASGDAAVEVLEEARTGEGAVWYLTDRLLTVRDLLGAAGTIIDHLDYDSFGNVTLETAPQYGDRFKFTGREFDPATGLYSYRARWYDPRQGRFISEDSWGLGAGDFNYYRYTFNAPTNWTDPSGHVVMLDYAGNLGLVHQALLSAVESCLTDLSAQVAVGGQQLAGQSNGGIPTPGPGWVQVQIESCAKFVGGAFANGVYGQLGTVLHYLDLVNSGQAVDCVEFNSTVDIDALSDYKLNVKVGCNPGGANRIQIGAGVTTVSLVQEVDQGLKENANQTWQNVKDHFGNCFAAGTCVLLAEPPRAADQAHTWYAGAWSYLAGASLGLSVLSALAAARRCKPEEEAENERDDFFADYERIMEEGEEEPLEPTPSLPWTPERVAEGGAVAVLAAPAKTRPLSVNTKKQVAQRAARPLDVRRCLWLAASVFFALFGSLLVMLPSGPAEQAKASPHTKVIEAIQVGDWVQAWNEETGQLEPRQVVHLFRNTSDHLRLLTIQNADGSEQLIQTTDGHPFWVPGEGWVDAGDLEAGDPVRDADGEEGVVVASEREEYPEGVPIYNFEVEGLHTYFVAQGADGEWVLVHNASNNLVYALTKRVGKKAQIVYVGISKQCAKARLAQHAKAKPLNSFDHMQVIATGLTRRKARNIEGSALHHIYQGNIPGIPVSSMLNERRLASNPIPGFVHSYNPGTKGTGTPGRPLMSPVDTASALKKKICKPLLRP